MTTQSKTTNMIVWYPRQEDKNKKNLRLNFGSLAIVSASYCNMFSLK